MSCCPLQIFLIYGMDIIQKGKDFCLKRNFKSAEICFQLAIQENPNNAEAHFNLAYIYLLHGHYQRGFEEFEWRLKIDDDLNRYYKSIYDQNKVWNGEDLDQKRILVYAEQGVGDGIQFFRYVKHLKSSGAYVMLHIHKPTAPLLKDHPWVDEIFTSDIGESISFPEYDYNCSIMSLPWKLKKFEVSGEPYIAAPPGNMIFPPHSIGIVWGGTKNHLNDANRSIPIKYFSELKGNLYSLQVEPRHDLGESSYPDLTIGIHNLMDTASFLRNLDLLISCDTSVAHLAGAIGVPCWLALPFMPDWRWGQFDNTTKWYNSMRIFRQKIPGDWDGVFKEMALEL